MKVLVTDISWPDTAIEDEVLGLVDAKTVLAQTGEEDELVELVRDADAILTCFAHVTPAVVAAGARLRVIGRYGVGTDNIAVEEATRRGIPVTNVPVYCTDEVTEHVLALLLAHVRGIVPYDRAVRPRRLESRDRPADPPRGGQHARDRGLRRDRADAGAQGARARPCGCGPRRRRGSRARRRRRARRAPRARRPRGLRLRARPALRRHPRAHRPRVPERDEAQRLPLQRCARRHR